MTTPLTALIPPPTPALIVLEEVLEANLLAMQRICDAGGVALRSHAKMHKCSALALRQIAVGAVGVCAQTLWEAEAMLAAGVEDVLVTSPPAPSLGGRIMEAAARGRLAVVVDDNRLAVALAENAAAHGRTLDVVIDVDVGQRRTGVAPEDVGALAAAIAALPGLRLRGLQAYAGHLQHLHQAHARRTAARVVHARLSGLLNDLRAQGFGRLTVTGGGTGTFHGDVSSGVFTEIQAGSYALMDVEYAACEGPLEGAWPFAGALFLAATVVSDRHHSHVTVDAGLKALSSDGPFARVAAGAPAGSVYRTMGDEHGAVFHPAAAARLKGVGDPLSFSALIETLDRETPRRKDAPVLGDIVWLQPGHVDPTINLHDALWLADAAGGLDRLAVDARRVSRPL